MKFITKCSGGSDNYDDRNYDEIMEFSPTSGEWTVVDNTMKTRCNHALSVLPADDVQQFCN